MSLGALVCGVVLSAAPARALGAAPVDELTGARRVCAAGPDAALARAQRMRGEAAVKAAGVLPNPSLVVQHQRALRGPKEEETTVGLSIPLGLGGRRFLLQDAAQARRAQALADAHATLFEAALAFREAYAAAALDEARVAVLTARQQALDALADTIRALQKGGEAAGYDLLRQETQARLHRRLLQSMKAKAEASRALLEVWLGEEVTVAAADLSALAGGRKAPMGSAKEATPQAEPPRVQSLLAASRASELEAQAARRRWVPDVELFAGYRALTGADSATGHGLSVSVTVPLTFFDHGQGEAAQAEAERAVAASTAGSLRREILSRAKAAEVRLKVLEASVAESERAVEDAAALEGKAGQLFKAGEASMTELLEAFRAVEDAALARIDALEEIITARLALMRARGTQLDATLDKECGGAASGEVK